MMQRTLLTACDWCACILLRQHLLYGEYATPELSMRYIRAEQQTAQHTAC